MLLVENMHVTPTFLGTSESTPVFLSEVAHNIPRAQDLHGIGRISNSQRPSTTQVQPPAVVRMAW